MLIELELIDRIYYDIKDYCESRGTDITEYIINTVEDRFYIDKYGDLNDKLRNNTDRYKLSADVSDKEDKAVVTEIKFEEENKPVIISQTEVKKEEPVISAEEKQSEKSEKVPTKKEGEKPVRKKRTLVSK